MWRHLRVVRRTTNTRRRYSINPLSEGERVSIDDGSSSSLDLQTGHIARFADSSVVASRGDSAVLATVVSKGSSANSGFAALSVDFRQSAAAVGKIPTNYLRREMGQTDADILVSRIIDRSIRPLIPAGVWDTIQVQCKPLAVEDDSDEVVLAVNAATTAMHLPIPTVTITSQLSSIPLTSPAAAVRVVLVDKKPLVNPPRSLIPKSPLDLLVTGSSDRRVVMIEMDGKEIAIDRFEEALDVGLNAINKIHEGMNDLQNRKGKKKNSIPNRIMNKRLQEQLEELCSIQIEFILTDSRHDKISRDEAIKKTYFDALKELKTQYEEMDIYGEHSALVKKIARSLILKSSIRCDGRGLDDFRQIGIKVDVFKKLHGSALFQRGQTQVLSTCTFDAPSAAFHPDSISQILGAQRRKSFMLHYEFPGYATNEMSTGRVANRRELGHGALAEKALKHVVPSEFPFCIRLACQVLESNGSSSMASVCAGSMALLDAGVPIKAQAAGVAIGLIREEEKPDEDYKILTDLMGFEDYAGDMDFKIAGTSNGFTAMQLDVKALGLSRQQLTESLQRGENAVRRLIHRMNEQIDKPRRQFKDTVPVIEQMTLEAYKRAVLFRGGGVNAKHIEAETGVKITVDDDKTISLISPNVGQLKEAKKMIGEMVTEQDESSFAFGQTIDVEVTGVVERGITVRLQPHGRSYLVPSSQLSNTPVLHANVLGFKEGDRVKMQWLGRDATTGAPRLSRRSLLSTGGSGTSAFKRK